MKIDTDLRAAIRSAYIIHKHSNKDYAARNKAEQQAIADLFKAKPVVRYSITKARAEINKLKEKIEAINRQIGETGLVESFYRTTSGVDEHTGYNISDQKKFAKVGGKFRFKEPKKWTFDAVIAQLASADETTGKKLLREIGIRWG